MVYDLLIVGGGVSGFSAAITAARHGKTVCILEQGRKPLRKLAASGNGRGNLLNLHPNEARYHGDSAFAMQVLGNDAPQEAIQFWQSIGVSLTVEQQELLYPASLWAQSAVDALVLAANLLDVNIISNACAQKAEYQNQHFVVSGTLGIPVFPEKPNKNKEPQVKTEPAHWRAHRLLVCGGGRAALREGSPDTYALMQTFGHTLTPLLPALCALRTKEKPSEHLQGVRVRCTCSLLNQDGKCKRQSAGEALFAKDGISGIAVMDLARYVSEADILSLDLREAVCGNAGINLFDWLKNRRALLQNRKCGDFLTGAVHPALFTEVLKRCRLRDEEQVFNLSDDLLWRIADVLIHFNYELKGPRSFEQAQVTAGGIVASDFDPITLQSHLQPGLYAAGEMLNVDGDCGGFNLLFALMSGIRVGESMK